MISIIKNDGTNIVYLSEQSCGFDGVIEVTNDEPSCSRWSGLI